MKTLLMIAALGSGAGLAFAPEAFRVEGVCKIDDRSVECWNTEGVLDPRLAQEVVLRGADTSFGFVPGRTNRYLMLRGRGEVSFAVNQGGSYAPIALLGERNDPGSLMAFRLATSPQERTTQVEVATTTTHGDAQLLRPRKGATVRVDGIRLRLVDVSPLLNDPRNNFSPFYGPFLSGPQWQVIGVREGRVDGDAGLTIEAIGKDGRPIAYVDAEGKPLDSDRERPKWNAFNASLRSAAPLPLPASRVASFVLLPTLSVGFRVATNVDPRWTSSFRVAHRVRTVTPVGPLPLDPKS